jgi:hypothetical protein
MAIAPHPAEKKAPARRTSGRRVFFRLQVKGARHAPDSSYSRLSKTPRRVRGPQAAKCSIHFSRRRPPRGLPLGVYVAKNTLRGESAFSRIFCVKTHGSERNLFCQKRQRPFLTSSYYPRTQAFRALPSGSSTRRPAVTLTSGAAARISATDVSMPLLPLVQKGRMVFPVRS